MTDPAIGMSDAAPFPVVLRAGESAAWVEWQLVLRPHGIQFKRDRESVEIKDADLSGFALADSQLSLHSVGGATVYLKGGPQLAEVALALDARICTLREVTRPLRAFGARRGRPGEDHDRFFAALMSARTKAESASDALGRLAAFDANDLRGETDKALNTFASNRFSSAPPERRALYETMNEQMQPLYITLDKLDAAANAARNAPDSDRFTLWREWLKAVDAVFVAADQAWLEILPLLDRVQSGRPKGWFRKAR